MSDYRRFRPSNRGNGREWYHIENKKDDVARVDIYEDIGYDPWFDEGIGAKQFVKDLREIKAPRIELHINSRGGFAFDGVTMYNALRDHPAFIAVTVDALAASAASIIAMAGDHVTMNRASELMLHDASGFCVGNAQDMEKTRDMLDHLSADIAAVYADRAGGSVADWREIMRGEQWYSAQEAVDAGLTDEVVELKEDAADEAKNRFDLRVFAYAGRAHAPAPKLRATNRELPRDSVPADGAVAKPEDGMTPEQLKVIGLPEDATDEQITEKLTELAAAAEQNPGDGETPKPDEGGEDDPGKPEPGSTETTPETPDVEKTDETAPTAKIPAGTVLVDAAALDSLKASAGRADQLFEEKRVRDRDALLNSAVKDWKIPPARLDHWRAQYDADPEGITKVVNELPEIIPVREIGHGGDGEDGGDATAYPTNFLSPAEKARIKQAQEA